MNTAIKRIATATVTLLLGYSCGHVVAIASNFSHPTETHIAQLTSLRDTLIVPGERVGPVTRNTSRRDLARLFGASRLTDKTIPGPEGEGRFLATDVNLGRERSFTVVWSDSTQTKPGSVRNLGSAWKTPEGIGVSTPMAELRRQLGEFQLYGLAWDYSGTILLENTRLSRYAGALILTVEPAPGAAQRFPNDYRAVLGDGTFSSNNPHWQPLNMRVAAITVMLDSDRGI